MTTVTYRKELKNQTENFVFVQADGCLYMRVGDEWIRKKYFTTYEVKNILKVPLDYVYMLCKHIGVQAPANKKRKFKITLPQLQLMAQTKTI